MCQAVETRVVDAHGEIVEGRSHGFGVGAVTRRFAEIGCGCRSCVGRGGVGLALGVAGLVWEGVEEVWSGIDFVFEES